MNIMIDLETMGTRPGSAIIAIGAAMFDTRHGVYNSSFYANVSLEDCLKHGLTVDADTIDWWMQQDEVPRHRLSSNRKPLLSALCDFRAWAGKFPGIDEDGWEMPPHSLVLWGCGPDFDIVLLREAFRACNLEWPYRYVNYMDFRTIKACAPNDYAPPSRIGLHDALADATYEAQIVVDIARLRKVDLL